MHGNPELIAAIRREIINSGGSITFARFMELALYHPQHGYYTTGQNRIGKTGDYFTSVSVSPLFGCILARQFQQWGVDEIIEIGAHRGQLRADILAAAPNLNYRVIETGDPLPDSITGVVFSNELFDAMPVHRVCGSQEVYVTGDFTEHLGSLSDDRLPRLPSGYCTEINLCAFDWFSDLTWRLRQGTYILTIDYGFERAEYFAPHHAAGHLQCYHHHTKSGNPYEHIGEQDITAHVEFTSLIEHGKTLGLETLLFTDQTHFLLQAGLAEIAAIVARDAGHPSHDRNAIHQLLHSTMGHGCKVLVQRKGT